MPCFHPVAMGQTATSKATQRGCGKCGGCRNEYARQWAVRCVHEAQLHDRNCFITLTFNDKFLNKKGSLVKIDFQLFLKRLRKYYSPLTFASCEQSVKRPWLFKMERKYKSMDMRFFHAGEYGEDMDRPHHHALLFNFDFPDKVPAYTGSTTVFRSPTLEWLWSDPQTHESYGYSSVGTVSYASALYVAQYCLKKMDGDIAPGHYQGRLPEYTSASRRPAVGYDWFKKYYETDLYSRDFTVINGVKGKIPKYYDKKYRLLNPHHYDMLKDVRIAKALVNGNNSPRALEAAEVILKQKQQQRSRSYEAKIP